MAVAVGSVQDQTFGYTDEVTTVVKSLTAPDVSGALIIGAAGIGKTTLMNAALVRIDKDTPVLRLRGSEAMRDRDLGILDIVLSQSGSTADVSAGAALSSIGAALAIRYPDSIPIVLVDNANLVDATSLSVLTQLAVAGRARILIAAESIRPPVDLVTSLWLSGDLIRVDLNGLDEAAVAALAETSGSRTFEGRSVSRLHAETGGNPLLLSHVLFRRDHLRTADRILCNIDPELRSVLEMVAMTGAVHYETLLQLCSADGLDSLVDAGIIRMSRARHGAVRIVEPVVASSLKSRVRPSHSLSLWKRLSEVADLEVMEGCALFGYLSWGGSLGFDQPEEKILEAVSWANSEGDYAGAAELASAAAEQSVELLLEAIRAEQGNHNIRAANKAFDRLLDRLDERWTEMSSEFLSRVATMDMRLTDPREPDRLRVGWLRNHLNMSIDRGRFDVTLARFDLKGGRFAEAVERAERVYRDHSCLTRHRLRACAVLGSASVLTGRVETGLKLIEQAELMFGLPGMTSLEREDASPQFFIARYTAGDWAGARASLSWMEARSGNRVSPRLSGFVGALVDLRTGHPARALAVLERVTMTTEDVGHVVINAATDFARTLLGDTTVQRWPRHSQPFEGDDFSYWVEFEASLFQLQTLAVTKPDKAADQLYTLGGAARSTGATTSAASAWLEAACLGHRAAIVELGGAAAEIDGRPGRLAGIVASAMTDGSPSALVEAASGAADYGAVVLCSTLAKLAQSRAIDAHDQQAAKDARILIGNSLRVIKFSSSGPRLQAVLSDFERHLVDGIMAGRTSQEIGATQHLSARTIEWHLSRIYRRLHVANRRELREVIVSWEDHP
ncbi:MULTISPECIES: LuxR C-terminal-related transcriptional regulator [Brevibacterium]|uniref:ATP-, maltotriose- and DNA-dependent transcriptional regulator MalT n=1 Tax=Brevibacterium antiquum CNRZ 918 TaxID=1255637 RepID=A0A2H1KZS0_9MICO|nr:MULTISPECIES: LuxR C-terminal-related transcriptional regulator [Brevibacterium]SMY05178.1 ATP-, maltotriose- and DNA-dependent transcriptional regulator MalT [Brevibacterium antiquum CNRZ 918]HCG56527.1 LuxR family transcriptional regulator [Brevibacterium sp.]